MNIGNMYLHDWRRNCTDGILQGYGRVSIRTGIQHNAIIRKACFMNFIYQLSFHIRLVIRKLYRWIPLFQFFQITFKRFGSINGRLPFAQQVDVRAIDYCILICILLLNFNNFVEEFGTKIRKRNEKGRQKKHNNKV